MFNNALISYLGITAETLKPLVQKVALTKFLTKNSSLFMSCKTIKCESGLSREGFTLYFNYLCSTVNITSMFTPVRSTPLRYGLISKQKFTDRPDVDVTLPTGIKMVQLRKGEMWGHRVLKNKNNKFSLERCFHFIFLTSVFSKH